MHITHIDNSLLDALADRVGEVSDELGATSETALCMRSDLLMAQGEVSDWGIPMDEIEILGR